MPKFESMGSGGCYNKKELKERGWSDAMIEKYLGEPDDVRNFRYGCEYLYAPIRVATHEAKPEFHQELEKVLQRRKAALESIDERGKALIELCRKMHIEVKYIDRSTVIYQACEDYNTYNEDRCLRRAYQEFDFVPATEESGEMFLARIAVNFIRHHLTKYDRTLNKIDNYKYLGNFYVDEAVKIVQRRIYNEIIKVYPYFQEECMRQMRSKDLI